MTARTLLHALRVLSIAAVYALTAKLGFSLATVAEQVTVVWPPSGIALAAVLLLGRGVWPGVWLGAFAANVTSHEGLGVAAVIATGNTLEAVLGAWLLERVGRFDLRFARMRDVFLLAFLGAGAAPAVSAAIGSLALCAGGLQGWDVFPALVRTWWMGDAMGILVLVPLALTSAAELRRKRWSARRGAEAAALFVGLVLVCLFAFRFRFAGFTRQYPLGYIVFPCLAWAALRFGQLGTSAAVAIASATAIGSTLGGSGPFAAASPTESLALVQTFLSVVALTTYLLGAAIEERRSADARRLAEYRVTQVIAGSASLQEAAPRILETLCTHLEWDVGGLWQVTAGGEALLYVEQWQRPGLNAASFQAASRALALTSGKGLPGRVLASAKPAWIEDVTRDPNFPRADVAARDGLRGAFGFPVILEGEVTAVLEFFSRQIRRPDEEILRSFAAIGNELGQYIGRKRVEAASRNAEQALLLSEERMRSILENAPLAVSIKDLEGRYVFLNQSAARLLGKHSVQEVVEHSDQELLPPDVAERARDSDRRVLLGRTALEFEESFPDPNDAGVWLTTKFPLCDASGAAYAICAISSDITSRRLAEDALKLADRRKDEFLAMLAHELRNPLASARNAVEILRRVGAQDPTLVWARDVVDRQLTRLSRLVDDLLDVARITTRKVKLVKVPLDLQKVVEWAVEGSRSALEERGHRLSVSLPEQPIQVDGDLVRLAQALGNLLDNAAKYTDQPGEISLGVERSGDEVRIRVRDPGIGIPSEALPRIFDLFAQEAPSLDRSRGGLGIGLSLVRQLVELHGGRVEAASRGAGQGSEFTLTLPILHGAHVPAPPAAEPAAAASRVSRRVLVVDDNRDSADTVSTLLALYGHDVRTAYDADDALLTATAFEPQVVVLDLGLPRKDGYEVARLLRSDPRMERALLIALTGYGQQSDRARTAEAGFDAHLTKPVDPELLRRLVAGERPTSRIPRG